MWITAMEVSPEADRGLKREVDGSEDNDAETEDRKRKKMCMKSRERGACKVCGDSATGMYFGALVCVPCKTFFLRYAGDNFGFLCKFEKQCEIATATRTQCKYCRYQKCLFVGMNRKERPAQVQLGEGQQLCVVCEDIANGVHFGAITCEGCKKFFRRGLTENASYVCKEDRQCAINPRTRNMCRYCRYQKCLRGGMSREAIQMGRPSKVRYTGKQAPSDSNKAKTVKAKSQCLAGNGGDGVSSSNGVEETLLKTNTNGIDSCQSSNMLHPSGYHPPIGSFCQQVEPSVVTSACREDATPPLTFMSTLDTCGLDPPSLDYRAVVVTPGVVDANSSFPPVIVKSEAADSFGGYWNGCFQTDRTPREPASFDMSYANNATTFTEDLCSSAIVASGPIDSMKHLKSEHASACAKARMTNGRNTQLQLQQQQQQQQQLLQDVSYSQALLPCNQQNYSHNSCPQMTVDNASVQHWPLQQQQQLQQQPQQQQQQPLITIQPQCEMPQQISCMISPLPTPSPPIDSARSTPRAPLDYSLTTIESSSATWTHGTPAAFAPGGVHGSRHIAEQLTQEINDALRKEAQRTSEGFRSDGDNQSTKSMSPPGGVETDLEFLPQYWVERSLPDGNVFFCEAHRCIIEQVTATYNTFVKTGSKINEALTHDYEEWLVKNPNASPENIPPEELRSKLVQNYTLSSVKYCAALPGFKAIGQGDQVTIMRLGQSQSRMMVAAVHWYDREIDDFRFFYPWRPHKSRPDGRFRHDLVRYAATVNKLSIDPIEAALLNALILIAADFPGLQQRDVIEEKRTLVLKAFRAYTTVKYGTPNNRIEQLFDLIPRLRELGLFHHRMTFSMVFPETDASSDT